ncbi:MAG: DUF368 domain-containing protein [Alteromonadaceae bacterium]|nr:DUF368 domain-containing protein [Alteromonadaceae bacterium]|tara:strand:- start:515 stop:1408 length:894 start_codon:yes stop_codon:yes gene_type:complete
MGAADIVPGVSGGTIAFISGIYERLLTAIAHGPAVLFSAMKHRQARRFWRELDGTFLLALLAGILTSIVSLASVISLLLEQQPVRLWSFFFGLIVAAIWYVGRQIDRFGPGEIAALVAGAVVSFGITLMVPGQIAVTSLTLFAAGAIAICAMILPGISGSFILLLMGMYAPVVNAIDERAILVLGIFAAGCLSGLLLFSRLIAWALRRYQAVALALLTGFMVGSLNKVWPWKLTQEWGEDRHGNPLPLVQANVGPVDYSSVTGEPHYLVSALGLAAAGFVLVLLLEWLGERQNKRTP